jgi:nitrite reductase/ring-hydroxylating ferredoxin subunit
MRIFKPGGTARAVVVNRDMSWVTDRLNTLMTERRLTIDVVARQLAMERSRLTAILAGAAIPNENLTKRLAKFFGEDVANWIGDVQALDPAKPAATRLPTDFIEVAKVSEVPQGEMKIVFNDLAVVANAAGKFYAFGNVCPHAAGPIGDGFLEDCVVECPWHAGRWDIRTGKALTLLATADIPLFDVRVADDAIEIRLNQAALTQGVVSGSGPAD